MINEKFNTNISQFDSEAIKKMALSNAFLINLLANDNVMGNCFCDNCRPKRLADLDGIDIRILHQCFDKLLPLSET